MKAVLLGAPGSGKGTLAGDLATQERYQHISSGQLLRDAMAKKTEIGLQIIETMNSGSLVDDEIVLGLVLAEVDALESGKGLILDGYPRTKKQAIDLDKAFALKNFFINKAVYLDIDNNVVVKRLTGRRTCTNCGSVFHVESMPPAKDGICDSCGSKLYIRSDDNKDTILNRIEIYEKEIASLLDYYKAEGKLTVVDASGTKAETYSKIKKILNI